MRNPKIVQQAIVDDGLVGRRGVFRDHAVEAHEARGFPVRWRKRELAEERRIAVTVVGLGLGDEIPAVAFGAKRDVVAAPVLDRARHVSEPLCRSLVAAGEVDADFMLRSSIGRQHIDRSADRRPSVECGVRTADDFDAARVVDRQRRDARAVVRQRLRDPVHEQQRVREFRIAARHAAQHDRVENAELRADDRARDMLDRLRKRLIVAVVHRGAADGVGLRRDLPDAERLFRRGHLDTFEKVRCDETVAPATARPSSLPTTEPSTTPPPCASARATGRHRKPSRTTRKNS